MTKNEWYDLIVKEFKVSRATAKTMFSSLLKTYEAKKRTTLADLVQKGNIDDTLFDLQNQDL